METLHCFSGYPESLGKDPVLSFGANGRAEGDPVVFFDCSFQRAPLPSWENVCSFWLLLGLLLHTFVVGDVINHSLF